MNNARNSSLRYIKCYFYNFFEKTFIQKNSYLVYWQCNNSSIYKILHLQN